MYFAPPLCEISVVAEVAPKPSDFWSVCTNCAPTLPDTRIAGIQFSIEIRLEKTGRDPLLDSPVARDIARVRLRRGAKNGLRGDRIEGDKVRSGYGIGLDRSRDDRRGIATLVPRALSLPQPPTDAGPGRQMK